MDLDRIWRFELARGFSRNPAQGACLLTAVSWLVYGQRTDRPSCVCPILAGVGRHVNDILNKRDRQRLKSFIWRLAESRDASAVERRACILVDQVMLGILNGLPIQERVAAHFVWLRAVVLIGLGAYRQAVVRVIFCFERHYNQADASRRAQLVDGVCKAFDTALSAGKQGEMDPQHATAAMDEYRTRCRPEPVLV
jgi:hypothetical protein